MINLKELESLRTKEELIKYFESKGQSITDEEIEALKQSYNDVNINVLTMQQLDEIAGGYGQLAIVKRGKTSHLTQVNRWVGNKENSRHTILQYDANSLKGKVGAALGLGFLADKIDINHYKDLMENEKRNLKLGNPNDIKSIEYKHLAYMIDKAQQLHRSVKNIENFDKFFDANKISEHTNIYNLFMETRNDNSPGYQTTSKALLGLSETPSVVHAIRAHLEHPGEIFEQQVHTSLSNVLASNREDIQGLVKNLPGKKPNLENPEQLDLKHYKNNFYEIIELTKGEQRQILVKDRSSHHLHLFEFDSKTHQCNFVKPDEGKNIYFSVNEPYLKLLVYNFDEITNLIDHNKMQYREKDKSIIHNHNLLMRQAIEKLKYCALDSTYTAGKQVVTKVEETFFVGKAGEKTYFVNTDADEVKVGAHETLQKATDLLKNCEIGSSYTAGDRVVTKIGENSFEFNKTLQFSEQDGKMYFVNTDANEVYVGVHETLQKAAGLLKSCEIGSTYTAGDRVLTRVEQNLFKYEFNRVIPDLQGREIKHKATYIADNNGNTVEIINGVIQEDSLTVPAREMLYDLLETIGICETQDIAGLIRIKNEGNNLYSCKTDDGSSYVYYKYKYETSPVIWGTDDKPSVNLDKKYEVESVGLLFAAKAGKAVYDLNNVACNIISEELKTTANGTITEKYGINVTKIDENLFSYETEEGVTCYFNKNGLLLRARNNKILVDAYYNEKNYNTVKTYVPKLELVETTLPEILINEDEDFLFGANTDRAKQLGECSNVVEGNSAQESPTKTTTTTTVEGQPDK